ncbi:MAG TPA: PAS domain S-box protein, partial [Proteobacteria bacterium]|nr:PAS domain S-box protein [Pseudomonadota bacterium]
MEHLNGVLRAIRNVNQLITREKDRDKLLDGVCQNLIEARNYRAGWVAVFDESGRLICASEAGWDETFEPMLERLKSTDLPYCVRRIFDGVDLELVEEPRSVCDECPMLKVCSDGAAVAVGMRHGNRLYGVLSIAVPKGSVLDEEERLLLKEVASDVAFALHDMELEEERIRVQEALRASEEKLRLLFDNVSDVIYMLDRDLKVLTITPSVERVLGYKPSELVGKPIFEHNILAPEYLELAANNLKKVFAGERIGPVEYEFIAKDGTRKFGEISGTPIVHKGEVVAALLVGRDVTERRRAEERYRQVVENANEAIVVAQDGKLKFVNPKAEELTGYSSEELLDMPFMELVHPDDRNMVVQRHLKRLRGEKLPHIYDFRIVTKDGRVRWAEINAIKIEWEGRAATLNFLNDITERKLAEEELRRSEEKYRAVFENTGTAMTIVEEDTTISLANRKFAELTGLPKEEIEGKKSWTEFVVGKDLERMKRYHKLRRKSPELAPKEYEFRFRDRNGNIRDVFITIDMIPGTKKSVASLIDISELKRIRRAL